MTLPLNQIILGDAIEQMKALPDNSINLILTDPPYFKVKAEWWDRQWEKPEAFLEWMDLVAEQWARILKPNGSLYCFASPRMASRIEVMLMERFNVLNRILWNKGNLPTGGRHKAVSKDSLRAFFPASESILFCEHYGADNIAKGEAGYAAKCDELRGFVFEPIRAYLDGERERAGLSIRAVAEAFQQKTGSRTVTGMAGHWFTSIQWTLPTEENYLWLRGLFNQGGDDYLRSQYEELRSQYEELRSQYEELRRPFFATADAPYTDVWEFKTVPTRQGKHLCEKPQALLQHIIQSSSRPGDVVLDCFAGSGSTLVAAKNLKRKFIGIEIDPHWVEAASGSLKDSCETLPLQRIARTQEVPIAA